MNQKLRRHSGRITPHVTLSEKKDFLINQCLEPKVYWDDWKDYRDGFRNKENKWGKKIRRMIFRRKEKKARINHLTSKLDIDEILNIFS